MSDSNQFFISFSEYRNFKACPFKHFVNNILFTYEKPNRYLLYGSTVHNTIEKILLEQITDKSEWRSIAYDQLVKASNVHYATSSFGQTMVNTLLISLEKLNIERFIKMDIVSVEQKLFEPLAIDHAGTTIYFKGYVDLIVRTSDGTILIIDWKTAKKPWNKYKKKDKELFGQLALYQHLYSQKYNIPVDQIDTQFIVLPFQGDPQPIDDVPITKKYRDFIVSDVVDVAKQILYLNPIDLQKRRHTDIKGSQCFHCQWCNHNSKLHSNGLCTPERGQIVSPAQITTVYDKK